MKGTVWSPSPTTVRTGTPDLGREILEGVRVGIAHHLGWAVAVTASAGHEVVDRRRIELIEPGMPTAPIEHEAKALDGGASARMVAEVRASALRAASASLDQLAASLPEPVVSISLRAWPPDFPDDIAVQRRPPYESRADSVMYCQVLCRTGVPRGCPPEPARVPDPESCQEAARSRLGCRYPSSLNSLHCVERHARY
jgi:hypothetical protein